MTDEPKIEPGYIHEAMHTTWVLMETFEKFVMDAPAVKGDEKADGMADSAHARMWELYQHLGEMMDPS